jgi:hypothetical protein
MFVALAGVGDIRTRVSARRVQWPVRAPTPHNREKGLIGKDPTDYAKAVAALKRRQDYYNHCRPHSALRRIFNLLFVQIPGVLVGGDGDALVPCP